MALSYLGPTALGPENKKDSTQKQVYVIRWRPSQCSVDPIEEIILDKYSPNHVIEKLSELSGIPVEDINYTEGPLSFPVEISCLDIEKKLKWKSITSDRFMYQNLSLLRYNDGFVIYYKDYRETMKWLTYEERSEIRRAEEARLKRIKEYKSKHGL